MAVYAEAPGCAELVIDDDGYGYVLLETDRDFKTPIGLVLKETDVYADIGRFVGPRGREVQTGDLLGYRNGRKPIPFAERAPASRSGAALDMPREIAVHALDDGEIRFAIGATGRKFALLLTDSGVSGVYSDLSRYVGTSARRVRANEIVGFRIDTSIATGSGAAAELARLRREAAFAREALLARAKLTRSTAPVSPPVPPTVSIAASDGWWFVGGLVVGILVGSAMMSPRPMRKRKRMTRRRHRQ